MTTSLQKKSRLFIAIPLPEFLKDALVECKEWLSSYPEMSAIQNWIEPSNFHITLHFLGDISQNKIKALQEIVKQTAQEFPLSLTMKDIGTFEQNDLPNVLWVGIEKNNEQLKNIYQQLAKKLEELEIDSEIDFKNSSFENYTPHVTLAYIRTDEETKKAIQKRLKRILVGEIGTWESNQIELISSTHTRDSSIYKVIN